MSNRPNRSNRSERSKSEAESEGLARFTAMADGSPADWQLVDLAHRRYVTGHADRVLDHLRLLDGEHGGYAVCRLTHSLQTAARAERDGRDDEYVLCALLHDIGDSLAPDNHAEIACAILKPFVSKQNLWMVEQHAVFQGYYFWHHMGGDRDARERFRDHPWFDYTAEFCARYDQCSFDPAWDTPPLEHFAPLVRDLLARPRFSWDDEQGS